ncbi:unnamed protein product [Peniophora sp. CBMAI 1063]|nr:unnamed protein product [Peniophora sp. CBMAI 1063]
MPHAIPATSLVYHDATWGKQDWSAWNSATAHTTSFHRAQELTEELNRETFPFGLFARANDIISHCAFSGHQLPSSLTGGAEINIRPVWPPHATKQRPIASPEETARIHGKIADIMAGCIELTRANAVKVAESVLELPALVEDGLQDRQSLWKDILVHLVLRFAIFQSKMGMTRQSVAPLLNIGSIHMTYSLISAREIVQGSFMMETCSSISTNIADIDDDFCIETDHVSLGVPGSHIIIGPLRLAQHSCRPNAKLFAVPNSYAYVLRALVDIPRRTAITVNKSLPPFISDTLGSTCWCPSCTMMQTDDSRDNLIRSSVLHPASKERSAKTARMKNVRRRQEKRRARGLQQTQTHGEPRNKPGRPKKQREKKRKDDIDVGGSDQSVFGLDTGESSSDGALAAALMDAYESLEEGEISS